MTSIREFHVLLKPNGTMIYNVIPQNLTGYYSLISIYPNELGTFVNELKIVNVYDDNDGVRRLNNTNFLAGTLGDSLEVDGFSLLDKILNLYNKVDIIELKANSNKIENTDFCPGCKQHFVDFVVSSLAITVYFYYFLFNYEKFKSMFYLINIVMPGETDIMSTLTLNMYLFVNYYIKALQSSDSPQLTKEWCGEVDNFWFNYGDYFKKGTLYKTDVPAFNSISSLSKIMSKQESDIKQSIAQFKKDYEESLNTINGIRDNISKILLDSSEDFKAKMNKITVLNITTGISVIDSLRKESELVIEKIQKEKNITDLMLTNVNLINDEKNKVLLVIDREKVNLEYIASTIANKIENDDKINQVLEKNINKILDNNKGNIEQEKFLAMNYIKQEKSGYETMAKNGKSAFEKMATECLSKFENMVSETSTNVDTQMDNIISSISASIEQRYNLTESALVEELRTQNAELTTGLLLSHNEIEKMKTQVANMESKINSMKNNLEINTRDLVIKYLKNMLE